MAKLILTTATVILGSTDLTDHVKQVTINYTADEVDVTSMTLLSKARLGGLKDWSLDVTFFNDYAVSSVNSTLWPLVGSTFSVEVRPTSAARGSTNPSFLGTGLMSSFSPIGQAVGTANEATVKIVGASGAALMLAFS